MISKSAFLCVAIFSLAITACSDQSTIASSVKSTATHNKARDPVFYAEKTLHPINSKLSFDEIRSRVKGFRIGQDSAKSEPLAYIFFDPLCVHCAKQAAQLMKPDASEIVGSIVWVPVGFLKPYSTLQGATILSSASPDMTFLKHETLVAAGNNKEYALNVKLATQENIDKVVNNTKVWEETGATKVPFIVTRSTKLKRTLSAYGVLEGFEMVEFLAESKT